MQEKDKQKPEEEKEKEREEEEKEIERLIIEYDTQTEPDPEKLFLDTYSKMSKIAKRLGIDGNIAEATTLLLKLLGVVNKHKQQLKGEKNRRLAIVAFALALTNYITNLDNLVFLLTLMEKMYGLYPAQSDRNVTDRL